MISISILGNDIKIELILACIALIMLIYVQIKGRSKKISVFHPASLLSTCFGLGYSKIMPGTIGSLVAVLMIMHIAFLPRISTITESTMLGILFASTAIIYGIGQWASGIYSARTGIKDPSEVIIDEIAGVFLTVSLIAIGFIIMVAVSRETFIYYLILSPFFLLISFILFRVYDITKPGLAGWADIKLEGATSIMLDDIFAAIYAAITFFIIFFIMHFTGVLGIIMSKIYPSLVG